MADPLSIAASCIGITAAVAKTSLTITTIIRTAHEARKVLSETKSQLIELDTVLDLLRHDSEVNPAFPESVRETVGGILQNCAVHMTDIDRVLDKHKVKSGSLRYTFAGKDDILM